MNLDPTSLANPANWPALFWLAIAIALAAGYALGVVVSGRQRNAARVRELEEELATTREEFETYRDQVSGHFTDTSKHLRDLALQYKTVYEHMAEGARTLCPDAAVPIEAGGLARELLPSSAREEGADEAGDTGAPRDGEDGAEPDAFASAVAASADTPDADEPDPFVAETEGVSADELESARLDASGEEDGAPAPLGSAPDALDPELPEELGGAPRSQGAPSTTANHGDTPESPRTPSA